MTRKPPTCEWCKHPHQSTKTRTVGTWSGKLCHECARAMRTEYDNGLATLAERTEKQRRKQMTRMTRELNKRPPR